MKISIFLFILILITNTCKGQNSYEGAVQSINEELGYKLNIDANLIYDRLDKVLLKRFSICSKSRKSLMDLNFSSIHQVKHSTLVNSSLF